MALLTRLSILLHLCVAIICASVASAQADPLPLWELEVGDNRVLLMGSVHFLRPSDYPLRAGLEAAYDLADHVIMEIDLSSMDPLAAQQSIAQLSIDPQGRNLAGIIGSSDFKTVSSKAETLGIPMLMFEQFEPWFAALSITQLRMVQLGFDPSWGVEARLTAKAIAEGKPMAGLETLEQQLGFMDRLDAATQEQFLLDSLDDAAKVKNEVSAIIDAWRAGDADGLESALLEGLRDAPALYDALLVQRNRNWVSPISALTKSDDNYLVVVGAMHLIGKDSVIAMLDAKGIKARQLNDSDFE